MATQRRPRSQGESASIVSDATRPNAAVSRSRFGLTIRSAYAANPRKTRTTTPAITASSIMGNDASELPAASVQYENRCDLRICRSL